MQQAIALAVILGIAGGLTGAWLLQREDDRRATFSLNGRSPRRYELVPKRSSVLTRQKSR